MHASIDKPHRYPIPSIVIPMLFSGQATAGEGIMGAGSDSDEMETTRGRRGGGGGGR